jgi:hypothetical protein
VAQFEIVILNKRSLRVKDPIELREAPRSWRHLNCVFGSLPLSISN